MKISFIIPAYNAGKFLKKCIDSVLEQEKENVEIVVVNDGSTDNTEEVCLKYKNKVNFKYLLQNNCGASSARNQGIKLASGDYIFFLDADDYLEKGSIKKFLEKIEQDSFDAITFNAIRYTAEGTVFDRLEQNNFEVDKGISGYKYVKQNGFCVHIVPWIWLIKRSFIMENSFFFLEGRVCEDAEWTARWFPYAKNIGYIDETLYCQVLSNNSVMRKNSLKRSKDLMYISKSIYISAIKLCEMGMNDICFSFINYASEEAFASFHSACSMGYKVADLEKEALFDDTISLILKHKKYFLIGRMLKWKKYAIFETIIRIYDYIRGYI